MLRFEFGWFLIIISILFFVIPILQYIRMFKKIPQFIRDICILITLPTALLGYYMIITSDNDLIIWLCEKFNSIPTNRMDFFLFGITFTTIFFSYIIFITRLRMNDENISIKNNKAKNIIKEKDNWCMNPPRFFITWTVISIFIMLFSFYYLGNKEISSTISLATLLAGIMVAWLAYITALIRTKKDLSKEIANKRQEWINDFRDNIANFTEICSRLTPDKIINELENKNTNMEQDKNSFSHNQARLSMLIYKITLLMNPKDYLAKAIFEMMQNARNSALNTSPLTINAGTYYIINHTYCVALSELVQCLIKVEWERTKYILKSRDEDEKDWHTEAYYEQFPGIVSKQTYFLSAGNLPSLLPEDIVSKLIDSFSLGENENKYVIEWHQKSTQIPKFSEYMADNYCCKGQQQLNPVIEIDS